MKRRVFLVSAAAAALACRSARAQQAARLAWIGSGTEAGSAVFLTAFRDGMRENALVEGRDFVASLARPGGNITGLTTMAEDRSTKLAEFVRELLPKARQLAFLINPLNPSNRAIFERVRGAAGAMGMEADVVEASSPEHIDEAFRVLSRKRLDVIITGFDFILLDQRDRIAAPGLAVKIPTFAGNPAFGDAGTLLAFGASPQAFYGRAAVYVKRILSGARPADLPVEQPTKFELVVNMKTANALGIKIPQSMLLRADRVIE